MEIKSGESVKIKSRQGLGKRYGNRNITSPSATSAGRGENTGTRSFSDFRKGQFFKHRLALLAVN